MLVPGAVLVFRAHAPEKFALVSAAIAVSYTKVSKTHIPMNTQLIRNLHGPSISLIS